MVCSDCHNPHGSPGPKLLKEVTVNETCYNCHAEKRGPLLWEHQPVRENCLNCHTPHGSNQARAADRAAVLPVPGLPREFRPPVRHSQRCAVEQPAGIGAPGKVFPPTGAIITNFRAFSRGCVNCHSQIHGSNNPSGAYFIR